MTKNIDFLICLMLIGMISTIGLAPYLVFEVMK